MAAWLPLRPNKRFNDGIKMLPRDRVEIQNIEASEDSMRSIAEAEKQYVPPVSPSQTRPAPLTSVLYTNLEQFVEYTLRLVIGLVLIWAAYKYIPGWAWVTIGLIVGLT